MSPFRIAVAVAAAAAVAAVPAAAPAQEAMEHDGAHGMYVLPGPVTTSGAEQAYADRLQRRSKARGARWATRTAARHDGYRGLGHSDAGKYVFHYNSAARIADKRRLDPRRPESLVYWRRGPGDVVLAGLMFRVPAAGRIPHPAGALMPWHVHYHCVAAGDPMANAGQGPCMEGELMHTGPTAMAHVWFVNDPAHAFDTDPPITALQDSMP